MRLNSRESSGPGERGRGAGADTEQVIDAVLAASRAIVALSVRSLATVAEDVTLTQ